MPSTPAHGSPAGPGPRPVRLAAPEVRAVFAPGRETTLARVAGDGLKALDIRRGDHVVLVRRQRAEHGDLAAILDAQGRAGLWKVYPEAATGQGERLRLSLGRPGSTRWATAGTRIHGVVVAVLRRPRPTRTSGS